MKRHGIIVIRKKTILLSILMMIVSLFLIVLFFSIFHHEKLPVYTSADTHKTVIFIDPGHGGIDGGANKDGILEKDINLTIAKKIKRYWRRRDSM